MHNLVPQNPLSREQPSKVIFLAGKDCFAEFFTLLQGWVSFLWTSRIECPMKQEDILRPKRPSRATFVSIGAFSELHNHLGKREFSREKKERAGPSSAEQRR